MKKNIKMSFKKPVTKNIIFHLMFITYKVNKPYLKTKNIITFLCFFL